WRMSLLRAGRARRTALGRLLRGQRELGGERRAAAGGGVDADPAADAADELAGDVEAEPGAADAALHVRIDAVELLEDPPLLRGFGPAVPAWSWLAGSTSLTACSRRPACDSITPSSWSRSSSSLPTSSRCRVSAEP